MKTNAELKQEIVALFELSFTGDTVASVLYLVRQAQLAEHDFLCIPCYHAGRLGLDYQRCGRGQELSRGYKESFEDQRRKEK